MGMLPRECKIELGELLAKGHSQFGPVAPRRPYREEDEEGDSGIGRLSMFEEHPLLAQQPQGAASDLSFLTTENPQAEAELEQRHDDANPELRKSLELKQQQQLGKTSVPNPSPY